MPLGRTETRAATLREQFQTLAIELRIALEIIERPAVIARPNMPAIRTQLLAAITAADAES